MNNLEINIHDSYFGSFSYERNNIHLHLELCSGVDCDIELINVGYFYLNDFTVDNIVFNVELIDISQHDSGELMIMIEDLLDEEITAEQIQHYIDNGQNTLFIMHPAYHCFALALCDKVIFRPLEQTHHA